MLQSQFNPQPPLCTYTLHSAQPLPHPCTGTLSVTWKLSSRLQLGGGAKASETSLQALRAPTATQEPDPEGWSRFPLSESPQPNARGQASPVGRGDSLFLRATHTQAISCFNKEGGWWLSY